MNFSNKVILNQENGLTVRHISLKGSNFEIGKKLAEVAKQNHEIDLKHLESSSKKHNQFIKDYFKKKFPIYSQRMKGVAETFHGDLEDNNYDFSGLPFNLEFPNNPISCSSVYFPPEFSEIKEGIMSRNYDFPLTTLPELMGIELSEEQKANIKPMMAEPYVIELYPEDEGYSSLCITSFDLLTGVLDGINSEGLTVCLNGDEIAMGQHFQNGVKFGSQAVGLNELQGMRLLLDTCATVEEAKKALKDNQHYFTFIPCHYLIADRSGKSFIFELDHQEKNQYFIDGENKPQVMTNHPVHLFPTSKHFPEKASFLEAGTSSFQRFSKVVDQLESINPPYSLETIKSLCQSVSISEVIKIIPEDYQMQILSQPGLSLTLWHSLYNTDRNNLQIKFLTEKKITKEGTFIENYSDYFTFELEE
ncbi:MAG: linear amide C-N hydrolase [Candidatus Heimdallarchaeota archaeon]|nr:linear amide C-N hydrolase [Candidatus Heimdallarchaeota archaeon]